MTERYRLLALGGPRSQWTRDLSHWVASGLLGADLTKCISVAELRARLEGPMQYSAVVVESTTTGLDRDLFDVAQRCRTPVLVVDVDRSNTQWSTLGASAVLRAPIDPVAVVDVLADSVVDSPRLQQVIGEPRLPTGRLIAVCGPGGTGASTIAMALAEGLPRSRVLVDFTRNGEMAMLHDVIDPMSTIEELVDMHRHRTPEQSEIEQSCMPVSSRGYDLVCGRRRAGAWSAMSPSSIDASIDGLRATYEYVIADVTADFECEHDGGSIDVEERNAAQLNIVRNADVVVIVGGPGLKGVASLVRVIREVHRVGVATEKLSLVTNRVAKRFAKRETEHAIADLTADLGGVGRVVAIAHHDIETVLCDVAPLPAPMVEALSKAVSRHLMSSPATLVDDSPVAVVAGELGTRSEVPR